jgi:6-phospho-3-hexuloisomerase
MNYEQVYKSVLEEHHQVYEKLDLTQVHAFMDQITKAKRIFFMGVGREGLTTRGFAMRIMHMGKETHWVWDDTTPNVGPGDLFIFTSGSGNIGHIHFVAELAKDAGATIAVVTGTRTGKTPNIADCVLWIPAHVFKGTDSVVPSKQPMGNLFEQTLFVIFDMIVMMLMDRLDISEDEMIARHRNVE